MRSICVRIRGPLVLVAPHLAIWELLSGVLALIDAQLEHWVRERPEHWYWLKDVTLG
ncbi:hypothetical protein [Halomonas lysinitropha]|uniref:Uncharacterized protein n=1 Tax=Halomonas lysinitropha TaxID=2607506 RepID=A0A5K1I6F7_9GAMM|nr:hypothetical protein [Halomonas lysinitropha]VVZ95758.1 hypothetical protein HALO32_01837 [Halomonas lysinitropha]